MITHYNPSDKKFKMLDKEKIIESGADKIFREDKRSHRLGI